MNSFALTPHMTNIEQLNKLIILIYYNISYTVQASEPTEEIKLHFTQHLWL